MINDLDNEQLQKLAGGYSNKACLKDFGTGIIEGTAAGAAWGGLPGAFIGAHVGVIGGGFYCLGGKLGG